MLASLSIILLVGLAMASICQKIKIPRIIGMLFTGIVIGPYVLDLIDSSILGISSDLRQIALIIILIKAGLSLNISDLKKVGRPAILMSFIPACFEILAFVIFAPLLLNTTIIESAIIGAVLGAVSPAIVVPKMVNLMENKYGTSKSIPQLILAGSSLDDVFVIVLFTAFVGMEQGETISAMSFVNIPVSIVLGILIGSIIGLILSLFFEFLYKKNKPIKNSVKTIIIIGFSFLIMAIELWLETYISISGLLGVMSMAIAIQMMSKNKDVIEDLSGKFSKLWLVAEILLFVLVGASVNIEYTLKAGGFSILLIFISLMFRSLGVTLCLIKTELNIKERLFCIIAYLPKATVQAAIGSVPLALGLGCGDIVLSIAVLSIIITAPIGAFLIDLTYKKLLENCSQT